MGFDQTLEIDQNGYLYIWLSNESKEARVWFDDLTITHAEHFVVQATDYGVWGDVIREQKSDIASYRYGYQGQFAEKDDETGWNHFELREYEPTIGRWHSFDPMKAHFSPYLGMSNSPVSFIDPTGGKPFSDFVNAKTGERVHIEDGINIVVVIEDKDWAGFIDFFNLTGSIISNSSQRFGILSQFGTNYIMDPILDFYEDHINPNHTEWGSFLYSDGNRVVMGPEAIEGEHTSNGGVVWMFDEYAELPNHRATVHLHYPPIEQNPSTHDRTFHQGEGVYYIVVTEQEVFFYNRGKTETYNTGIRNVTRWSPTGVNFSINKSSFSK